MTIGEQAPALPKAELSLGETRGVINPVGAYLEELRFGDVPLLESYYHNDAGRSRGGLFVAWPFFGPGEAFADYEITDQHGLTRKEIWHRADAGDNNAYARFVHNISDQDKYGKFVGLFGSISYTLGENASGSPVLTCSILTINNSNISLPAAPGPHPYFPRVESNGVFELHATNNMGQSGRHEFIAANLGQAQLIDGDTSAVQFHSGSMLVTMTNNELPKNVVWSDDPDRIICVEPTHAGMIRTPEQLSGIMLEPGDMLSASTTIVWQPIR